MSITEAIAKNEKVFMDNLEYLLKFLIPFSKLTNNIFRFLFVILFEIRRAQMQVDALLVPEGFGAVMGLPSLQSVITAQAKLEETTVPKSQKYFSANSKFKT